MPTTAADSVTLAVEHTSQQLFKPFRIGQWTKLAFVGLLAGELGANGFSRSHFRFPHQSGASMHMRLPDSLGMDPVMLAVFIGAVVAAALAIGIILMFIGSVMRFVLFDSIVARECHIRAGWNRRLGAGWRYFVWKLLYLLLTTVGLLVVVGIPAAYAFEVGWLREPKEHLPVLITGGAILCLILFTTFLVTAVVLVLTKDFVVPLMALENVDAMEGWRWLWPMIKAEKGAFAAYVGMKIVLSLAAAALIGIATLILGLVMALPGIALGILAVFTGQTMGLTWNAHTIALVVAIGCILLAFFFYLVSLLSVPVMVFFPAYSVHFFAGRYPRLRALLSLAAPATNLSPGAAPVPR